MKNYQNLIGYLLIAAAIVIAGFLIAKAIEMGVMNLKQSIAYHAELLR